jgi:hypothetical protein
MTKEQLEFYLNRKNTVGCKRARYPKRRPAGRADSPFEALNDTEVLRFGRRGRKPEGIPFPAMRTIY